MACKEIDHMRANLSANLSAKLGSYYTSLERQFADPNSLIRQQNAVAAQEARIVHAQKLKEANALREAYVKQSQNNRSAHATRISNLQRQSPSTHPESGARQEASAPLTSRRKPAPARRAPASRAPRPPAPS